MIKVFKSDSKKTFDEKRIVAWYKTSGSTKEMCSSNRPPKLVKARGKRRYLCLRCSTVVSVAHLKSCLQEDDLMAGNHSVPTLLLMNFIQIKNSWEVEKIV